MNLFSDCDALFLYLHGFKIAPSSEVSRWQDFHEPVLFEDTG